MTELFIEHESARGWELIYSGRVEFVSRARPAQKYTPELLARVNKTNVSRGYPRLQMKDLHKAPARAWMAYSEGV